MLAAELPIHTELKLLPEVWLVKSVGRGAVSASGNYHVSDSLDPLIASMTQ